MTLPRFSGIFVPTVTPFTSDGAIDVESYRSLVRHLLDAGVHGLVVNGTTGESPTVDWDDVEQLVRLTQEEVRARPKPVPVIVGTGTNDTASTLVQTGRARELGADAALVVVPYYNRPSQAGIVEHFKQVAGVGLPILCYNIPYRTGVAMDGKTLRSVLAMDGVAGIKESTGGLSNTFDMLTWCDKSILCGEDMLFFASLCAGGAGGILAAANVHTREFVAVFDELSRGELAAARARFLRLIPLLGLLFEESNPGPVKWVLARQGIIKTAALRLPMTGITTGLQDRLEAALKKLA